MSAPPVITLRRTVPYLERFADQEFRLTINDMSSDPDSVVIGVTGSSGGKRVPVCAGEELMVGSTRWRVEHVVVGDRGSVVLRRVTDDDAP